MKIKVNEENIRLDQYLANSLDRSRSKIQKDIKEGLVCVNGKTVNSSYILNIDDEISITERQNIDSNIKSSDIDIDVVYEDEYLLVINKQSGLVVHPAPGHYTDTLVNALATKFKLSNMDSDRPGIVHRIDKDTSGLMLVAKDEKTHEKLSEMIKNKEVERIYIALVYGVINHDTGTIDAPIGRDPNNRQKMCVTDKNSKDSITHFKVLKRYKDKTLVECKLETGRTHQIRVHFNYINHPVVGDPVYGKKTNVTEFGQYLHSKSIRFTHPITNQELYFEVDLPKEFKDMLENLENE
ncbi:MAG: RluA family pseudouridine synthase [Bacilli bacterium]